jgi:hypothetical protein
MPVWQFEDIEFLGADNRPMRRLMAGMILQSMRDMLDISDPAACRRAKEWISDDGIHRHLTFANCCVGLGIDEDCAREQIRRFGAEDLVCCLKILSDEGGEVATTSRRPRRERGRFHGTHYLVYHAMVCLAPDDPGEDDGSLSDIDWDGEAREDLEGSDGVASDDGERERKVSSG